MKERGYLTVTVKKSATTGNGKIEAHQFGEFPAIAVTSCQLSVCTFDEFINTPVLIASDTGTEYVADEIAPRERREKFIDCLKAACREMNIDPADWPLLYLYEGRTPAHMVWPDQIKWPDGVRPAYIIPVDLWELSEDPDAAFFDAEKEIAFLGGGLGSAGCVANLFHLSDATAPEDEKE